MFINTFRLPIIVDLMLSALVVVAGYNMDIRFLYQKKQMVQQQTNIIKMQIQSKQDTIKKIKLASPAVLKQPLPTVTTLGVIDLLAILEKIIFAANVTPNLFEPVNLREEAGLCIYPIKLEVDGAYKNLLGFINNLLALPYLIGIEELNLQKKKDSDQDELTMQILLTDLATI